jgi:hypothetical protein
MKICSKARVVQGSLLLTTFARVCGKFCSETSHIAAAHGARTSIFKLTMQEHQVFKKINEDKQANPYSKHTSWKKQGTFPTQIFNSMLLISE